jgi:DNA polymerase
VPNPRRAFVLDFETRSGADLTKLGAHRYAEDPTTELACAVWSPAPGEFSGGLGRDPEWRDRFVAGIEGMGQDGRIVAHNAGFERAIWRHCMPWVPLPSIDRWDCTAARAAAIGLPRSLEHVNLVLGLQQQKDIEGRKLMLALAKPRAGKFKSPTIQELERLLAYCEQDVRAERELDGILPALHPLDRAAWELDILLNERGVAFDREHCENAIATMTILQTRELARFQQLTGLDKPSKRAKFQAWLNERGVPARDTQADTMAAIADGKWPAGKPAPVEVREACGIVRALGRSSITKYRSALDRQCLDGRARDLLVFCGASTGRWTGSGFQPQNMPRGKIKDADAAARAVALRDPDAIEILYGDPAELLSHSVRGIVIAGPGRTLSVCDWSSVEARVTAWVSGDRGLLDDFRAGRDPYVSMARVIFDLVPEAIVTPEQRFVGKIAILGLGYGMGAEKFMATCAKQGRAIATDLAKHTVDAYRTRFRDSIVAAWYKLEKASMGATRDPSGRGVQAARTVWALGRKAGLPVLTCRLPSGRSLHYWQPRVAPKMTPWGERRPALFHWSVNSLTREWSESDAYGGLLLENVVQAISRDLLAVAHPVIEAAGMPVVLHVHDEVVAETKCDRAAELAVIMSTPPTWAADLPLAAAGWSGRRYRK